MRAVGPEPGRRSGLPRFAYNRAALPGASRRLPLLACLVPMPIREMNKRKLGADPTSRRFMGDSAPRVRRLDGHSAAFLLAQIDETDRLIDLVVYRLYGLSSEEVEIVEKGLGG